MQNTFVNMVYPSSDGGLLEINTEKFYLEIKNWEKKLFKNFYLGNGLNHKQLL